LKLKLAYFVASCGYAGYFPFAPGTVGSAVGVLFDRLLRATVPVWTQGLVIAALTIVGIVAAEIVEKDTHEDPSLVVVDELVGMLLSVFLLPLSWMGLVLGFLIFRIFDIIKPFPCRQSERLPGGLGIMADDIIAGIYTNLVLRLIGLMWPALYY
jgi:phosphatidylglycerophosphatase A